MEKEPALPKEFFRIQTDYARKLAEVTEVPFEQALLENTVFYKRIGIDDWNHDPDSHLWLSLVSKIRAGEDPTEAAYRMYMDEYAKYPKLDMAKKCFTYHFDDDDKTIHIHFANNFVTKESPLDPVNLPARREELINIFREVKQKYPEDSEVEGYSWLYAYEAYKNLFPPEFRANLKVGEPGVKGNGAWGQFLNHQGEMSPKRVNEFLEKLKVANRKEEVEESFSIPTYEAGAKVKYFYDFWGL